VDDRARVAAPLDQLTGATAAHQQHVATDRRHLHSSNRQRRYVRPSLPAHPHTCKNTFVTFAILVTFFTFFNVFFIFQTFFLKNVGKVQSGKQINKKHFQNNSNEIDQ